jgi:hypothetical protein
METEKFKCDILDGESLGVYARRLRDRVEELEAEVERLREEREAWTRLFGTTQLTHAKAKLQAAEAEVERLRREIDQRESERVKHIGAVQAAERRAEEAERLVVLYSGEGKDDLPEEAEYRRLASIPSDKRTPQQTERLLYLARWIPTQLDDKILRTRIGDEPEVPGGICGIAPDNKPALRALIANARRALDGEGE